MPDPNNATNNVRAKLELGRSLTRSLSHDLASPLATIKLVANFLTKRLNNIEWQHQTDLSEEEVEKIINAPQLIADYAQKANTYMGMVKYRYDPMEEDEEYHLSPLSAVACINDALHNYPFKKGDRDYIDWNNNANNFTFLGHEILVRQVLFNLLSNALFAVKKAGHGEIIIELQNSSTKPTIHIKNSGKKILLSNAAKLFDPFYTDRDNGAGMGLFFCRRAMKKMKGEIHYQPSSDETNFALSFEPAHKEPE